ncbi:ribosome maturation factor RimM [Compostibacter hankyongensis]|uniref:Ribosome maturation factor RimM n=1 Tax=Compostibacter hankyongensis TaxID=1007089 RepID=A0ABP8FYI1_9BACT
MPGYFNIGKIVATHGLKGELVLQHRLPEATGLSQDDVLFLETKKDSFLPYFITALRPGQRETVYLQLEGITTRESARTLLQKQAYLEEARFRQLAGSGSWLSLLGFMLEDSVAGELGTVAEIVELPGQWLAKVYRQERELLIPLNESTLQQIDHAGQRIRVTLPEGLLDIY